MREPSGFVFEEEEDDKETLEADLDDYRHDMWVEMQLEDDE